ncbi:MAG: outer membrane protein assembly factor BamE [Betaproteobacteria bacterium]|nr:outer membrane protein assembly factor BamE [Betaproteobacteria bacterium]MBI2960516.1 outer membrane protein assembly factor BamE [Betaproteobacteria bacterium]
MKSASAALLLMAAAGLAAGCAPGWTQDVRPWWTLHERDFAPIVPAQTTKAEVQALLGKPLLTMVFRNLDEEVWDYRFSDGVKRHIAHVYFDPQGRAKYYWTHPDNCPFSPAGCY